MRSKAPLLLGRRSRTTRVFRRVVVVVVVLLFVFVASLSYMIYHSLGDGDSAFTPNGDITANQNTPPNNAKSAVSSATPSIAAANTAVGAAATMYAPDDMPYSENLDQLLELLRIYTAARGIAVKQSPLEALPDLAGAVNRNNNVNGGLGLPDELQLTGVNELRANAAAAGGGYDDTGLQTQWMLDDPAVIRAEQEAYVERYIAPVQADAPLTPLRVLKAYYDPQSPRSLHQLAAAAEKSMNDDGFATYIQRSFTFFDPSHAARRGYGMEGSIFVAVPFTLRDITPDMVSAIAARATTPLPAAAAAVGPDTANAAALRNPLDGADDAASAQDIDGFSEVQRTAALCAATVESVFRQAHHSVGVTVATIDVVVATGLNSKEEVDLAAPPDVRWPVTEEERRNTSLTRQRRYDRITCEPPNFRSGWEDASYGFSWKDNLRTRRVLVPLANLEKTGHTNTAAGATGGAAAPRAFELPDLGRYATLELYRGESYVFFLSPGSIALPNWDLKLRLLYLRTPQHQRAVLSSRPTPAVVRHALAAAVVKEWARQPYLLFSSLTESVAKNTNNNNEENAGADAGRDAVITNTPPPLDWTGKRLLQTFPDSVANWLTEARGEAALALWLVTPRWLWLTVVDAIHEWDALSSKSSPHPPTEANAVSAAPATRKQSLRDVLSEAMVREILSDAAADTVAPAKLDLASVVVTVEDLRGAATTGGGGRAQVHGAGATTHTNQPILTTSLTEAEVYKLLFLMEKRAPLPNEPITDMSKLATRDVSAELAKGRSPVTAATGGAIVEAGLVTCGTAGTPLSYYSVKDAALIKRSFEYCWIVQHRSALRQLAERLTHSAGAMTVLTTAAATSSAPAKKDTKGVKCSEDQGKLSWYESTVHSHDEASQCLADMRYMDPSETPLLNGDNTTTMLAIEEEDSAAAERWFVSTTNAGRLRGSSSVPDGREVFQTTNTGPAVSSKTTTRYVLQSVASADFLFAPAEAFFDIAPEDRLRTRGGTLAEQLKKTRASKATGAVAEATSLYADRPESVPLDPSLHYLVSGALDLYLTAALWTRGWNIFGVTEAVVGGIDAPKMKADGEDAPPEMCDLADNEGINYNKNSGVATVPAAVRAAQDFAEAKFWALVEAHRAAGTPLGPLYASQFEAKAAKARFPLRRTLQQFETFANLKLDELRKRKEFEN